MKIDPRAEDLGREAVRASIARSLRDLVAAQGTIADAPADLRDRVLPIYLAVAKVALLNVYGGRTPNQEQNKAMAESLRQEESWVPVSAQDVFELLEGLCSDNYQPQIAADQLPPTVFITAGYLLTRYDKALGHEDFYKYLDAILNNLSTSA